MLRSALTLLLACGGSTPTVDSVEPSEIETADEVAPVDDAVTVNEQEEQPRDEYCPELPPGESQRTVLANRERPYLVHGRVVGASNERGRYDGESVRYRIRIIEVVDYIHGTEATVDESYQRSFPLYERINERHPPRSSIEELRRGQEYVLAVELPGEGPTTTPDDLPRSLRRRFGPNSVPLVAITPSDRLEEIRAREQRDSEARVAAMANSRALTFVHRFSGRSDSAEGMEAMANTVADFVTTHFASRLHVELVFEAPNMRTVHGATLFDYAFTARHEGEDLPPGRLEVRVDLDGEFDSFRIVWEGASRWGERTSVEPSALAELVERDLEIRIDAGVATRDTLDDGLTALQVLVGGAITRPGRPPRFQHHIETHVTPRCFAILEFHTRY